MSNQRAFRFGVLLSERFAPHAPLPRSREGWADKARELEELGYSTVTLPDHLDSAFAPLLGLMAAADATSRLRLGTMVMAADLRHPAVLAKETATLALLSDNRFELGLGAGWDASDYAAAGLTFDRPAVRIARLAEHVSILRSLWAGEDGDHDGKHLHATVNAAAAATCKASIPLLIGGGGRRVLSFAAQHADIVGVNVPIPDGAFTAAAVATATTDATRERIGWIEEAAGDRFARIELSIAPLAVVTDNRSAALATLASRFGQSTDHVAASPLFLIGSLDKITEDIQQRREHYGFSYIVFTGGSEQALGRLVQTLTDT
ncbi:MAG TPA: TIGR03621 family F420-dependent LLM class oxidoreductase [Acidimicrobiales bacterium]|jgi:probable F420-dependent oxidoreductase